MLYTFLAYLILVIVRPHEFVEGLADYDLPRYLLLTTFVLWMFRVGKTLTAPQQLLVPVFCAFAAISRPLSGWFGGMFPALGELIPLMMLFFTCAALMEEERTALPVLTVTCLCTLVLVAHGIDQVTHDGVGWTGETMFVDEGAPRIKYIGPFGDPNDLAMLFAICIPMCIYLGRRCGVLFRLFWFASAGFLVYGILLTNSRGGLLATLAIAGLWGARRLGKVATAVVAALTVPALLAATRLSQMSAGEESAAGRVDAWYEALQLFFSHPVGGVGMTQFIDYNGLTAHNSWLLVLAEIGFLGYIAWFVLVALCVQQMYVLGPGPVPVARGAPVESSPDRELATTMFYSAIGILVTAFFLSRSYSVCFFLFWGWTAGIYNGARKRNPALPAVGLPEYGKRWGVAAVASIPVFYVLVRILLMT